jgi:hypothetical protein
MRFDAACVLLGVLIGGLQAAPSPYSHGDPSDAEQYMLELINRARTNPAQEGQFLDQVNTPYSRLARSDHPEYYTNLPLEFSAYPAAPPLAFNPALLEAAREHSADMQINKYFAHNTPSGITPFDRITDAGFEYETAGENIAGMGCLTVSDVIESHYGLMVDCYNIMDSTYHLGHRLTLLDQAFKEIGIGFSGNRDDGYGTQNFASRLSNPICFIVGVVYRDKNTNAQYDPGEGISNVLVTPNIGGNTAITSASGGYAVPIQPVETNTVIKKVPLKIKTAPWSEVDPYDTAFRDDYLASAPTVTADITLSGTGLPTTGITRVSIKRPVLINYSLKGSDNYSYELSMVTSMNVKVDYVLPAQDSASRTPDQIASSSSNPTSQQVIFFPQPQNQSYDPRGSFELRAVLSGRSLNYSSSNPKVVKVTGSTALIIGVGQSQITARDNSGGALPVTRSVRVMQGTQSLANFPAIADRTFGDAPLSIAAPASTSGLPVSVKVLSGPAKLFGRKITITGVGTVVLAANQPGNTLYQKAPQVTVSFTVARAPQTIGALVSIAEQTYPLAKAIKFTVPRSSSKLPVTVAVQSGPAILRQAKGIYTLTLSGQGDVVLSANQPGNANYLPAAEVTSEFRIR